MPSFIMDTYSGRKLNLSSPRPEQIALEDIAAALSKVCRFGAQATRFHSVAQHAVLVMTFTAEELGVGSSSLVSLGQALDWCLAVE